MSFWGFVFIVILGITLYIWRMKAVVTIAVLVIGWYILFPFGSFNYKLTLLVDTPEGQKIGSAVRKIIVAKMPKLLPEEHGGSVDIKGEAVVVDLGQRGVLFALLKENSRGEGDAKYMLLKEFPTDNVLMSLKGIWYYQTLKIKKELSFDKLPMLVRFRDINDPKTVELVDPNDLEKTFGKGVRLVSATLEMTDERVTERVQKYMPPFDEKTGYLKWINSLKYGDYRLIGPYDFRAGVR